MSLSLGELAVRFGCELRGDPDVRVDSIAPLSSAHPGAVTFLANPRHASQLASTQATAVILDAKSAANSPVAALIATNPHATFARVAALLYPRPIAPAGIHPSAVIADDARIDPSAHVGPFVSIGPRVVIGPRAHIGPHSMIEDGVQIDEDVRLVGRATLCHDVKIGARTVVQPGAVIGGDGFGFAKDGERWLHVPQVGTVVIGPDCEVGANTTIDRGAIGDTVLEEGVKLDNQIQIGHNCRIGAHTAMAACVGLSGSVTVGKRCMIGGMVGIVGHLSICDDVAVTGLTMVSSSITQPGVYSGGIPAEGARTWRRLVGRFKQLDSFARRLAALERATGTRSADNQGEDDD
ncbi:MAG TPA: UDP-3-O-(3-hydroxymyristoyl)glucosamine N-acyltransferase [Vicinamibacterales bacterium]|jgi:UDP-3-O-[3-hydroxymyristoyl] glucosamine N-acyltransferase|nr:UDP-3-O-(3-hydroxymyristoyl)glucosamine N-acyltransferase [Steroidobacteraceae bacterium]HVZ21856.1 UDP-3-O-(3-hydroxymyristoyl)glucosamine N-acyltransferase [Vicinamibacterales bacterium]